MDRVVALADCNSFYASVHEAEQPELRGKEIIVAGDPEKRTGIVLASSYPAKAKGIKTGMPLWEAESLCPNAVFFKPHFRLYFDYSARILRIMQDFTDLCESFSVDESFMEMTSIIHLFGQPVEIAQKLKDRIFREVGIKCSVGIGPNKLIAKMASNLVKPDGLTYLPTIEDYRNVFYNKPVRKLFGIGPRYEKHLRYFNVHTIGDLASFPVDILKKRWGKNGELMWYCAQGIDNSPVVPGSLDVSKSIGKQQTLPCDIWGFEKIKIVIRELSEIVSRRVRKGGYVGKTVFLVLRDSQLRFLGRSMAMSAYTDLSDEIYKTACELLETHWDNSWSVRLVGVTVSGLVKKEFEQLDLFGEKEKQLKLTQACDSIWDRFGEDAIFRGVSLTRESIND